MGVYLTKPITDKKSEEFVEDCSTCTMCGSAVSMQGWRMDQEDAHNAIPHFDDDVAMFGVYDGHGGPEVADYIAQELPNFIKSHKLFSKETIAEHIRDILIEFDNQIVQPETLKRLNTMATDSHDGNNGCVDESPASAVAENEVDMLREEAKLTIQDVLKMHYMSSPPDGDDETNNNNKRSLADALLGRIDREEKDADDEDDSDDASFKSESQNDEDSEDSGDDEDSSSAMDDDCEDGNENVGVEDDEKNGESKSKLPVPKINGEMSEIESVVGPGYDSGSTAVIAMLIGGKQLVVANLGDSRCILSRDGTAVDLTFDHKPSDDVERKRVEKAGGTVTSDGRINNGLNLSRALGDHSYKRRKDLTPIEQMISCQADVKTIDLDLATDNFIVIACDGIWNSMTSQEVVDFVSKRLSSKSNNSPEHLTAICGELFDHCLAEDTTGDGTGCDNMTAVIVKFTSKDKAMNE